MDELFNDIPNGDLGDRAMVSLFHGCQWIDLTVDGMEVSINVRQATKLRDWLNRALPAHSAGESGG